MVARMLQGERVLVVAIVACGAAMLAEWLLVSYGQPAGAAIAADVSSVLSGIVVIRLAVILFFRGLLRAARVRPARIVEDLATAALVVGWCFAWMRLSGMKPENLFATSAVVTAVIAFAMQDTLGNVVGGTLLQLDRSIRVGDWVRIDDVSGRVAEIRWRHTAIETRNGETVVIPNGWLLKNRFTVVGSRSAQAAPWRRVVHFNVDLSAAPGDVCRTLEDSVRNALIEDVASDPGPSAVLMEVGARYGVYWLRYWLTNPARDDPTDSQVRAHALAALQRAGMRLGAPYQEQLDIRDDDARRAAQSQQELRHRIDALARVELFGALSQAEREALARHLVYAPFVAGDVMTRQGAMAHWLYLVIAGEADVWLDAAGGRERIATIASGGVFGEMGMMTGEARSATVTARTDVVCYRLDKEGFGQIIRGRPDIAEAISRVLAKRQSQLQDRRTSAELSALQPRQDHILGRVRAFFGLEETIPSE